MSCSSSWDARPDVLPGLVIPAFSGWTHRVEREMRDRVAFPELVDRIRRGPPLLGPFGLPILRETGNVHEYFIHHEDVRRPNGGGPRRLSAELEGALWRRLRLIAPLLLRRVQGFGVTVVRRGVDGDTITARRGTPTVRLEGRAGELFLYLFNRREPAAVTVRGPRDAIERLAATRLGL